MKAHNDQDRAALAASLRTAIARVAAEADVAGILADRAAARLAAAGRTDRAVLEARAAAARREAASIRGTLAALHERMRELEKMQPKRLALGDVLLRLAEPAFRADLVEGSALARGLARRLLRDDPAARALARDDVDRLAEHLRSSARAHLHNTQRTQAARR